MRARPDIVRALVPYHHARYRAPCNLDCFYCYEKPHPASAPENTLSLVKQNLGRARAAGYRAAVFGAGEFLLLPFWEQVVRAAIEFGYEETWMLSNLRPLDESRIERLAASGLTGVVGTIFSLDDEDARAVSGRGNVFSSQMEAARLIGRHGGLRFGVHLVLTRPVEKGLWENILRLREALNAPLQSLMLSAIEPISESVRQHPYYTHGLDLDWESLFVKAEQEGLFLVVQNIPACILGQYAHHSLLPRMRTARILHGWPDDPELARFVNQAESLAQRIEPAGICVGCPLLVVCHRYFDYPVKRKVEDIDDLKVVERLLAEEGLFGDSGSIVSALRWIESRTETDHRTP